MNASSKICKQCKCEISFDARVCKHCGSPYVYDFTPGIFTSLFVLIFLGSIVSFIWGLCGANWGEDNLIFKDNQDFYWKMILYGMLVGSISVLLICIMFAIQQENKSQKSEETMKWYKNK